MRCARLIQAVAGLLCCSLVPLGCTRSGAEESDGSRAASESSRSGDAPVRRGREEPAATDAATVEPYIEDLLDRYDDVVNQIVTDPGVASDDEHPLIREYLSLFEPGSRQAAALVDLWAQRGAAGESMQPFDPERPASESRLDGEIEVRSADEVAFPTCEDASFVLYDAMGRVTTRVRDRQQPGQGEAVRVDGRWLLRRLDAFANTATCRSRGSE